MNNKEKFEQDFVMKINHSMMEPVCAKYLILTPQVAEEAIRNARIQEIYIIDVDQAKLQEIDPEKTYMKRALHKDIIFDYGIS